MLLITGATGYVGSALVALLAGEGRDVRAAVRDRAKAERVLPRGVDVVVADTADTEALARAAKGCSGVLHVAGSVGSAPEETWEANVEGTRRVLAAAVEAGAERFVFTSSGAAVIDATGLVSEEPTAPPALTDPYSRSKAAAERLVLAAAADGLRATVVSPASIYGPSPLGPHSYNGLFLAAARGEVRQVVDARVGWVLAEDVATLHALALDHGEPGKRYLAYGEVASFGHMVHMFADAVGGQRVEVLPTGSSLGPDADTYARRSEVYGMLPPVRVDDTGARALGFRPRGVAEGLALTAAWTSGL